MSLEAGWSLGGKRLILTVATGRNGTGYVSHLLHGMPGICCLHEPDPQFYTVMRAVQTDPGLAERFLLEQKLPAIRSFPEPVYFETSHLACKGFLEPLMTRGVPLDLRCCGPSRAQNPLSRKRHERKHCWSTQWPGALKWIPCVAKGRHR